MRVAFGAMALGVGALAAPAGAIELVVEPLNRTITITSATQQTCDISLGPVQCTTTSFGFYPSALPIPTLDVPELNGTFSFEGYAKTGTLTTYHATGSVTFLNGTLLNTTYNLSYSSISGLGGPVITTETATAYVIDVPVEVVRTREVIFPVPEAATWAMLLVGFGAVGCALRRRREEVQFFLHP